MKKLLPNHPISQKFNSLQEYATQLGIILEFSHGVMVLRQEGDKTEYKVVDVDNPEYSVVVFPPDMEYKITFEDE